MTEALGVSRRKRGNVAERVALKLQASIVNINARKSRAFDTHSLVPENSVLITSRCDIRVTLVST